MFIDLEKTYDNVPFNKMLEILQETSIDQCYIRAIKAGYKDASCVIKVNNKLSAPFKITKA